MNTFEAAILRDFGEREDFERVLTHALRRGCGGRVLLSLMADGSLRLTGTKDPDISFGAVLLDLTLGRKASLTAAFDVKDLRMELTGGSSATLTGKAGYLTLFASTGRVAASGLEVMSAEVNAQSKADVSLWITDRFIGKTTTNARITYKGQPAVVRGGAKFMGGEISHVE